MELRREDPGRQAIMPFLQKQYLFENQEGRFGYSVLNGDPLIEEQVRIITVPTGSIITMATDGYPELRESLEESEASLLNLLTEDPFCYKENLQTKGLQNENRIFDDRCYLQFND